jgi:hypothetical protein
MASACCQPMRAATEYVDIDLGTCVQPEHPTLVGKELDPGAS